MHYYGAKEPTWTANFSTYCESRASAFWPQKKITTCCSAALQFDSTASIFKEDLWKSITRHWLVMTVSSTWSLRQLLGFTVHWLQCLFRQIHCTFWFTFVYWKDITKTSRYNSMVNQLHHPASRFFHAKFISRCLACTVSLCWTVFLKSKFFFNYIPYDRIQLFVYDNVSLK